MGYKCIHVWEDSILKGIGFDEQRQRYAILRDNCIAKLAATAQIPVVNHARMGITAPEGEKDMREADLSPGGLGLIEFGGNDCDMPWTNIAQNPAAPMSPKSR